MRTLGKIVVGTILGCFSLNVSPVLADIRLLIQKLETPQATIKNLTATWPLHDQKAMIELRADRVQLPAQHINLVDPYIRCVLKQPDPQTVSCVDGTAYIPLPDLDRRTLPFNLSARLGDQPKYQFNAPLIRVLGGRIALSAQSDGIRHQVQVNGKKISVPALWAKTDPSVRKIFALKHGRASFQVKGSIRGAEQPNWHANLQVSGLSGQSPDGLKVLNDFGFKVVARRLGETDRYQIRASSSQGEGYVDPVYLSLFDYPVEFNAILDLRQTGRPALRNFKLNQRGVGALQGDLHYQQDPKAAGTELRLTSVTADLAPLSELYILPFGLGTAMDSLQFSGQLKGDLHWRADAMGHTNGSLVLRRVNVRDSQKRIELFGLQLDANFNRQQASTLSWQSGHLLTLEFGAVDTKLMLDADHVRLLEPLNLSLFDGELQVDRLHLSQMRSDDRQLEFEAYLTPISLSKVTESFGWTPMQGKVSGVIPNMTYKADTLELGGNLLVKVFDGHVLVQQMTVRGLFSDFPILHADIQLKNLDLGLITTQFDVGSIEGRLGGYINDLVLENWQPVAFDAWLGTPEGDKSRRRISQRAIENISDLGGVGVAGVLSRGFMRFFDTFGYKRIAIGCVLSNGICDVKGVIPASTGYYLVEGGGLPRINIIGHNRKILWRVFLQRLERVLATE